MNTHDVILLIFAILGGLAMFIFGMNLMTEGLKVAAGTGLRSVLGAATNNRLAGILMGTVLGTLVQSSAATVMLVGFINAGLMTLAQSVPPMLGANIGTTLSMQLISFRLSDYCFLAIALGLILDLAAPHKKAKSLGRAVLGFGLIFLGMSTMSEAIKPHRDLFAQFLSAARGGGLSHLVLGTLIATAITAVIQSSGAVVGMCFALLSAGVFTSVEEVYPMILGARIGTCATALLGSMGANINARRSAISHLVFNVLTSLAAIASAPLFIQLARWSSDDLIRQTANINTAVAALGALPFLIFSPFYARFIIRITPSRRTPPEPSFLDTKLMAFPEKALYAAIQELQRVARVCLRSLHLSLDIIFTLDRRAIHAIKLNETVVDEIKRAMKSYVATMATKALSRRQAILIQTLNQCMADIERIGDHVDELCDITLRRHRHPGGRFSGEDLQVLVDLYKGAAQVLQMVICSLDPENQDFQATAQAILQARDAYMERSINANATMTERVVNGNLPALQGVYFSEYRAALDRIVKHAKMIALAEKHPDFWIKRKKLAKMAKEAPPIELPPRVEPRDYLDQLHGENYL